MTLPRPQRLTHLCPPGSLLKQFGASTHIARKTSGDQDPAYLTLIRQCPCLKCGLDPAAEAAHVRFSSAAFGKSSGLNKKPPDRFAVALCGWDHRLARDAQHQRNEEAFWYELGINILITAERLYAQRGDLVAMRAVVFTAIAERTRSTP